MNRREFSAGAACVLGAAALGWPTLSLAQRRPEEGKDYRVVSGKPVPVEAPAGKIEVVEFFWYECPHCNAFEPRLVAWASKLRPDVVLRRVPVGFRDEFVPQQRLFYSLEAMGKLGQVHEKVFEAIHKNNATLRREAEIVKFVESQGVDGAKFRQLYNSPEVSARARKATELQDAYNIEGVPTLAVGGRFFTDATMAGGMDRSLAVTDYLIAEVRRGNK